MAKKCPPGKYYCFDDKKCKKIPRGYHIGARGYLARDDDNETKKNGNGNSNGNGNGGNGAGNGNGGSGGGANGNGGGMGEEVVYEVLRPLVPGVSHTVRKIAKDRAKNPMMPANLEMPVPKKSELSQYAMYHGTVKKSADQIMKSGKFKKSVGDVLNPDGSVYRSKRAFATDDPQRAKHYADMAAKRTGGKPEVLAVKVRDSNIQQPAGGKPDEYYVKTKAMKPVGRGVKPIKIEKGQVMQNSFDPMLVSDNVKEGMYNHPEFALITVAVDELEKGLMELEGITHDSVDKLMQGIAKRNNISPTLLHNQFKSKHLTIPDDWAIRQRMNRMKESVEDILATPVFSSKKSKNMSSIKKITSVPVKKAKVVEAKMTEKEMEKREDIVKGMKKNKSGFKKRYGKDAKSVMYATATKLAMKEESQEEMLARVRAAQDKLQTKKEIKDKVKKQVTPRIHPQKGEIIDDGYKYNVSEEGLRDWFGKSSGTTKSGRKVKGWVQVGGKYDGKPCARQPGQKSTPKCVSSSKRASMSDKERDSAARRKRAADPNQPQKSGAAKPTNVSTDPKRKMKENYFSEKKKVEIKLNPKKKIGVKVTDIGAGGKEYVRKDTMNEAKDKKGKGSGTKDACYHKVKSRYSVWPSAYASGALVKCRKVGAANWGNKSKNEGFSSMQVAALEAAGMIELNEAGKKCWKGYEKKGTKKMFGKTYNNCVKKEEVEFQEGSYEDFEKKSGVKAVKPKKEVELPKTPEKKPENTYSSGNPVGKENVKRKMINVSPGSKREVASRGILGKIKHVVTGEEYAPVTEGVSFLKRKKEEKKPKKAMDAGARLRRKKQRQEYAAKISGSEDNVPDDIRDHVELAAESKTRLVKNGHTYKVILTWRGKTYMVQMFVPSVSRPTRLQIEKEVQKLYPDAKVMSFLPRDLEPGEPTVMMGEEKHKRDEYGDIVGGPKISKKDKKKNLAKNEKDEDHTTTTAEEYVAEDDMKGMSVSSGHKRPTKSGAGMTAKGVAAYRRKNPGSKLQTAVTGKVKKGSKDAKRRKSYCARSAGQMKKFPKAAKDPNSRLRQARKRWKC